MAKNSIADELAAFGKNRPSANKCKTCALDPEIREAIEASGLPRTVIRDFLKSKGISISENSVGRHLRSHVS